MKLLLHSDHLYKKLPTSILLCLLSFLCLSSKLSAQQYHFQSQQQDAIQVLASLEQQFNIQFNINHDYLPDGHFSFSCSGDLTQILDITFSILDRDYFALDQNVFTIRNSPLGISKKITPTTFLGFIADEYGLPVIGATVSLHTFQKATLSDAHGRFEFSGYYASSEKIEIRYLGYEPVIISFQKLKQLENSTIQLKTKSHVLRGINVVERDYSWGNYDELGISKIDTRKISEIGGRADKDALSIIQLLPGISSASENLSEIQIRGGLPDQTKYQWNGIQIFQTSHFFGKLSSVNPLMVDEISINKNGASARDAGQASGTISLADYSQADSLQVNSHLDFLYANVGIRLPLFKNKLQINGAFRQSYFGLYENVLFDNLFEQTFQFGRIPDDAYFIDLFNNNEFINPISELRFRDYSFSANWQLSEKEELKFSLLNFENQLIYYKELVGFNFTPADTLQLSNRGHSLSYKRSWTTQLSSQLFWSKSLYENKYRYLERSDSIELSDTENQFNRIEQEVFRFENDYTYRNWQFSLGYQRERWDFESFYDSRDVFGYTVWYDANGNAHEHSLFTQAEWQPSQYWHLEGGVRWSKYSRSNRKLIEPRIHLSTFPNKNWMFHIHYGHYHQNLNQINVFTNFSVESRFWYLSSEEDEFYNEIPIAQNKQWSIGAVYQKNNWSFSLDFYDKNISNIHTNAFDFTYLENVYRLAEMDAYGLEAVFRFNKKWFSLFWSYEYAREQYQVPSLEDSHPSPYTQPHKISLFQCFKWKKLETALQWRFASGRPYSVPSAFNTYLDEWGNEQAELIYDELFTEREANYHTLDITSQYQFSCSKKLDAIVGISLQNVYNRRNTVKTFYAIDYKQTPYGQERLARQGLPFTPNIFLKLQW